MVLAESGGHGISQSCGKPPSPSSERIGLLARLEQSNTDPSALLAPSGEVPNEDPPTDIISKYDATLDADKLELVLRLPLPLECDVVLAAERGARCLRRRGRGLH